MLRDLPTAVFHLLSGMLSFTLLRGILCFFANAGFEMHCVVALQGACALLLPEYLPSPTAEKVRSKNAGWGALDPAAIEETACL
jgi:hypothetical protein